MNNKIAIGAAFVAGAALGFVVSFKFANKRYSAIAEAEIESVKKMMRNRIEKCDDQNEENVKTIINDSFSFDFNDFDIIGVDVSNDSSEYEEDYIDLKHPSEDGITIEYGPEIDEDRKYRDKAYVITDAELGELPDYAVVTLTYYADNILADETNNIVEDTDRIVGSDFESYFGGDHPNEVLIRNDSVKCDYEITKSDLTYIESLPGRKEEE